ncbi:hypothetical protein [Psychrobacillus lasiicapitis]|uniref:Uncharacterized protein n=1 Tax=Psychrobacillus lasiicapitis TaxID=1636719 RepID=A0A544TAF2_9BACI|nr:hypothetical protein [Psychrobacillus lasiicapitis]TQR14444.1 hypothetical protein FG382_08290 [Psychrobacillus lasiicapitis]GGA31298.1 hypothetical protein GCM10011384_20970 [Psychrobacillus lasiicapitis]
MTILLMYKELNQLVDDYYKCPDLHIKELILNDLIFLTDALLSSHETELKTEVTLPLESN